MRFSSVSLNVLIFAADLIFALQAPLGQDDGKRSNIPVGLFNELEEHSRIVDISYCVGMTSLGIQKPFKCLSRCSDFKSFELLTTWNTGPLLADSCGYIALSHSPASPRIIVAFRGTYSISNTIVDLTTVPQEYVPYPGNDTDSDELENYPMIPSHLIKQLGSLSTDPPPADPPKCTNCTVHMGFYASWLNTRRWILPVVTKALKDYPEYKLTLVGHSLGGAVAALAGLDMKARGFDPHVTTFGEPRIGNHALAQYLDGRFNLTSQSKFSKFRRVTHAGDPIPLLPLEEWGFEMHGGEIFIEKPDLPPDVGDIRFCNGASDPACIAGNDTTISSVKVRLSGIDRRIEESSSKVAGDKQQEAIIARDFWPIPSRFRLWELFFAHRDYFWRLGLCVPGGDPKDWYRKYPHDTGFGAEL